MQQRSDLYDQGIKNWGYYTGESFWEPGWLGPRLDKSQPNSDRVMAEVERIFQSSNRIKEVVDRHYRSLIGKPAKWYFNGEEEPLTKEADEQLQAWINRINRLAVGQETQLGSAIAEAVRNLKIYGRGYIRAWSPKRFAQSDNPIHRVCLHSPVPTAVWIERDGDGFIEIIYYTYTEEVNDSSTTYTEIQRVNPETGLTEFYTENGVVTELPIREPDITLNLNGGYTVYEMRKESMITPSMKRAQNGINYALTMMLRNMSYSGFLREVITNAQPPGEWIEDKTAPGGEKFIPNASGMNAGPGESMFLTGIPQYDPDGNLTGYSTPGITHQQPVSPATFLETTRAFVSNIYEECSQAHLLLSDAIISGVSREQSRQDFEQALYEDAGIISAAIAGSYLSALLMMNQERADQYAGLDIVVELQLATTKPTPEERAQNREDYKIGLKARATAMADAGVSDPDAEADLVKQEMKEAAAAVPANPLNGNGALPNPLSSLN